MKKIVLITILLTQYTQNLLREAIIASIIILNTTVFLASKKLSIASKRLSYAGFFSRLYKVWSKSHINRSLV